MDMVDPGEVRFDFILVPVFPNTVKWPCPARAHLKTRIRCSNQWGMLANNWIHETRATLGITISLWACVNCLREWSTRHGAYYFLGQSSRFLALANMGMDMAWVGIWPLAAFLQAIFRHPLIQWDFRIRSGTFLKHSKGFHSKKLRIISLRSRPFLAHATFAFLIPASDLFMPEWVIANTDPTNRERTIRQLVKYFVDSWPFRRVWKGSLV